MKRHTCIASALLVILTSTLRFAAVVTGAWKSEVKGPDGNSFPLTFNFKQDGTKLTGSVSSPGGDIDISDGKVDG